MAGEVDTKQFYCNTVRGKHKFVEITVLMYVQASLWDIIGLSLDL